MAEKDIYFKQNNLFNPNKQGVKVHVYGAGSVGSHVALGLAKIGVKDITVYDYDVVEMENSPAQVYSPEQEGKGKVEALQEIVKFMTGTTITGFPDCKVTSNGIMSSDESYCHKYLDVTLNSVHILAMDDIETTRTVAKELSGFPVHILNGRIGGFQFEKYYAYGRYTEDFLRTMEGEFSEDPCGEKCLWIVNSMLASKIIADVIKLTKGQEPVYSVIGSPMGEDSMVQEKQEGNR